MSIGYGNGKVIIFGEHFVVYGCPAIAVGISHKSVVEIKKADEILFSTSMRGCNKEYSENAIKYILKAMNIKDKIHAHLGGNLLTAGGLGSSAAFCVGLVRALDLEYKLGLTNEQVNKYAYEGEYAFHGNPSGIDNTMATYGGAIKFIRRQGGFEKINVGKPFTLVVASTGIYSPTSDMVSTVKKFKENNPVEFEKLFNEAKEIVKNGLISLENGDFQKLGSLIDSNQLLLRRIGVSIDESEKIIKIAKDNGALGSKVTGGGGGGCCIALAKDENSAKEILNKIKESGFDGFVTKVESTK